MNGLAPGAIAENIITYFGGAAGGFMILAAILITFLLASIGAIQQHRIMQTFYYGSGAWISAFLVKTIIAWA